ncbi:hypothetical protein Plo01_36160 [Planobispora longispora]|uniref:Uncharacterized protein n=1 Tax=Planobispora longispora TaxID=28887 RepID=A0A8J3RNU4_9ACTN|nr:hypothetical protein Plo01_36160 [Planobispora longispora]
MAALLIEMERSEPDYAEHARSAIEWLTGGEPLETITELNVCEFLWYTLPTKVGGDRPAVARALGRLLRRGGLERYAALCVAPVTSQILRAYARSGEDAGLAAYQAALDATGVLPPDVPELRWSSIMGPEELGAHGACSAALELAIVSGELDPGSSPDRERLTRHWLTAPRTELGGDNWLHRVQGERLNRWVLGRGTAWRDLAQPFEVRLHAPIPVPRGDHLQALRWLLRAGRRPGGIPLTPQGGLAPVVLDESRWSDAELAAVREAALEMGTLREEDAPRRLVTTPDGGRLLGAPDLLWETATATLLVATAGEHDFRVSAREVALMLLAEGRPADRESVTAVIGCEEWRHPEIEASLTELTRRLDALGLRREGALTSEGRSAALAALRGHALRPRRYVSMT